MLHAAHLDHASIIHTLPSDVSDVLARAARMVADARGTIDREPGAARKCLEQLSVLLANAGNAPVAAATLLAEAPAARRDAAAVRGGLATWQLRRVAQYIEDHIDSNIAVAMLADVARVSTGHFCRAFKTSVGETPHNFLMRQRIRRAQLLMLHTDESLSRIACACGLTDQAHLTRLFRRMVGETPMLWRRTWQCQH